nr:hypothetical protein [Tanacetum cinerariifolium]
EPQVNAKEADMQRALEESMKSMYDVPWGLLPPVVIREPEPEKYQPLPEAGPDPDAQVEGQARTDHGAQDEGQAGSNPDDQFEGQARPDPGNAGAGEQPMPSLV